MSTTLVTRTQNTYRSNNQEVQKKMNRRRERGRQGPAEEAQAGLEWGHFSAREFQAQDQPTFFMVVT